MGKVFLAKDLSLGRRVVLKFLRPETSGDHTAAERFRREARTASALNHPGICTIHEISEHDGQPFIVMEWLEGQSLRDLLAARRLSIDEILTLASEIADALDAAHRAGVVHRDIKPGNIFVTAGRRAKLLDFGLAKLEPTRVAASPQHPTIASDEHLTETGALLGTVAYMSPEQARGDRLDHRTDLFSFGAVLYEMATGTVPFKGSNAAVVLHEVLGKSPTPPMLVNAAVPPELDRVITKALEKDRNLRCQSAAEMLSDLKRLKRDSSDAPALPSASDPMQVAAGNSAAEHSDVRVVADLLKRRRIVFALTAMALVLAFIGVFYVGGLRQSELTATSLEEIKMEPLTTSGNAIRGAISPDGKFVAYVQREGNLDSLWIRPTATKSDKEIVPAEPGVFILGVTVKPDGNFVDYVRLDRNQTPALWRVPYIGGVPKPLIDNVYSPVGWSPDGRQMAFVRTTKDATPTSLVITDADGRNEQVLPITSDENLRLFSVAMVGISTVPAPAWSPDSLVIAALSLDTAAGYRGRTFFVRVSDGEILDSPEQGGTTGVAWIDNSSLLINRVAGLFRVTYPGNESSPVTTDLSTYTGISLTADPTSAVIGRTERQGSIWIGDSTGQVREEHAHPVADPVINGTALMLTWAGDRVLFTGTGPDLMFLDPGSTQPQTVLEKATSGVVTPDGSTIVYLSMKAGEAGSLWRADASGGHATQLDPGNHLFPQIVDDKYVVYTDVALHPWITPLAAGEKEKRRIRNGIQGNFFVSLDGKSMLYTDNSVPKQPYIVICDLPDCTVTHRLKPPPRSSMRRWAPNRAIAFVREGNIWIQQLDETPPRPLTQFKDNRLIVDFAWSRDGKRLAIARITESRNIVLLKGLKPNSH